jgi:hypothetical protein
LPIIPASFGSILYRCSRRANPEKGEEGVCLSADHGCAIRGGTAFLARERKQRGGFRFRNDIDDGEARVKFAGEWRERERRRHPDRRGVDEKVAAGDLSTSCEGAATGKMCLNAGGKSGGSVPVEIENADRSCT